MRILQVCATHPNPDAAKGGGDLRNWQDFTALTELGHEVHVASPSGEVRADAESARRAASLRTFAPRRARRGWLPAALRYGLDAGSLRLRFPNYDGMRSEVARLADEVRADLVWAATVWNSVLVPRDRSFVFSQRDFVHNLRRLKSEQLGIGLSRPSVAGLERIRAIEFGTGRRAAGVMCASSTERDDFIAAGVNAVYVPIVGPTTPAPTGDVASVARAHLFGNANTAMRVCRLHLRDEVWPHLGDDRGGVEWHQVGAQPAGARDPSWEWARERFRCHGFVEDLATVFERGDLSIVPYRHGTGFRTKFTVAAAYGVINVGYDETFSCAPEFEPGTDSAAAASPRDLAELIRELGGDAATRRRLADGARSVYERYFTFESRLPDYAKFMEGLKL